MLHLSLLALPRHSSRWRLLQPYQLHQIIWKGFPEVPRGSGHAHFLYRHDERRHEHSVLVQSAAAPDWSFLEGEREARVQTRAFNPEGVAAGTRLRFFVRANPVVLRRGYDDAESRSGRGRRIAVGSDRARQAERLGLPPQQIPTREEQLIAWLERKGTEGGFTVAYAVAGPNRDVVIRSDAARRPMTFTTVDFDGILVVADPTLFVAALARGIGRGKAFGFGLLSVKRA